MSEFDDVCPAICAYYYEDHQFSWTPLCSPLDLAIFAYMLCTHWGIISFLLFAEHVSVSCSEGSSKADDSNASWEGCINIETNLHQCHSS